MLYHAAKRLWIGKQRILLRLGVIVGILCLEVFVGRFVFRNRWRPEFVIGVAALPVALVIFYRGGQLEHGILALVLTGGLVNFITVSTGTASRIVISLVVAVGLVGLWIARLVLIEKRVWLKPSPINRPLVMFVVVAVIAYVWSNAFRDPVLIIWDSFPVVQLAALVVIVLLPLLALMVSNRIEGTRWLRWLAWIIVGMGAAYLMVYHYFDGLFRFVLNNGAGGLFSTWVVVFAYALALFDEDLPLWLRGLLLGLVAAFVHRYFILGRSWLSGWLPVVAAGLVITFMRSKALFVFVLIVGVIYVGLNFAHYYETIYVSGVNEGGLQRLDLWRMNLEHVAAHPLFGMGPAGYAIYNMTYHPEDARSTHNNYFDILAQTGIVGLSAFLWLFGAFLYTGFRTTRALAGRRNFEEAFANATLAGCVGALVGMMLGDWVVPFAYNATIKAFDHSLYTWVFLGAMVSLYRVVKTGGDGQARPAPGN